MHTAFGHLVLYLEIIKPRLIAILCREAGVEEIFFYAWPVAKTAIIKHFQLVGDDERHDMMVKTFLKHDKPTNAPVAVLERMDGFEPMMKVENVC